MHLHLWLLLLRGVAFSSALSVNTTDTSVTVDKRAFSVPPHTPDGTARAGPWPVRPGPDGTPVSPLRYAWLSAEARLELEPILLKAIELWRPAMEFSSLRIIPDPRAGPGQRSGSIAREERDCLMIGRIPSNAVPYTQTIIGYMYGPQPRSMAQFNLNEGAVRHLMMFKPSGNFDYDVRSMAHELGKADGTHASAHLSIIDIGTRTFCWVPNRPDRDQYIDINLANLKGYDAFIERLRGFSKLPDIPVGMHVNEKLEKCMQNTALLKDPALRFPALGSFQVITANTLYGIFEDDAAFDFDSIMMYDSNVDPDWNSPVMQRKIPTAHGRLIYCGGSSDPAKPQPSPLDIERVQKLYPPHTMVADGHSAAGQGSVDGDGRELQSGQ